MSIFDLHRDVLADYRDFVRSFLLIADEKARKFVDVSKWHAKRIIQAFQNQRPTVYKAYNTTTYYATHETRSYQTAFDLLARTNRGFQETFAPF